VWTAEPVRPSPPTPPKTSRLTRPTQEACLAQWVADRLGVTGDILVGGSWWTDGHCALRLFALPQPERRWRWRCTSEGGEHWGLEGDELCSVWEEIAPEAEPVPTPTWPDTLARLRRHRHHPARAEAHPRPSPLWPTAKARRFRAVDAVWALGSVMSAGADIPAVEAFVTVQERYVQAARGLVAPSRWTVTPALTPEQATKHRLPPATPAVVGWRGGEVVAVIAPVVVPEVPTSHVRRRLQAPRQGSRR
jgi:hypothetical protein